MNDIPSDFERFQDLFPNARLIDEPELTYESVVRVMDEELSKEGWDLPPGVAIMQGSHLGAQFVEVPLTEAIHNNFAVEFPVLVSEMVRFMKEYHPSQGQMPEFFQYLMDECLGKGFMGLLLSTEGWSVAEPDKETEPVKHAEWERAVRLHNFHEHPDRVEERNTMLLTPVCDVHWMRRSRDGDVDYIFLDGEQWEPGRYGMILEAARGFMRALLSLQMLKGLVDPDIIAYWGRQKAKEAGFTGEQLVLHEEMTTLSTNFLTQLAQYRAGNFDRDELIAVMRRIQVLAEALGYSGDDGPPLPDLDNL